ncbi:MAG: DNA internalization-related competence protein ComEC/Rec2 [Kofleriaceae bacterium]
MWTVRAPIVAAISFAIGIAGASSVRDTGIADSVIWVAAAIALIASLRWPLLLLIALAIAGAARTSDDPGVLPSALVANDRHLDRVVGVLTTPIVTTPRGQGAALDSGSAAIWVWADRPLVAGQRVAVTGTLRTAGAATNPGVPAWRNPGGAAFEITARELEVIVDEPSLGDRVWRSAVATQTRWSRAIDAAGGDRDARGALRGIVVGDRSQVSEAFDERWRATGIFHVLSVSGLHLAVVAGLAFAALRRLIACSPWGGRVRPARWAALPALAIAVAYTMITGAQLATLRALIVVGLMFLAAALDRPVRLIDALGVAALVLLAVRPHDLFDPSFQLSFTAALTLALRPQPPAVSVHRVRSWLTRGFVTSLWIAIATAPITAFHFHQVTAGGVIGNLVLTPVIELVALPLALAGLVLDAAPLIRIATELVAWVDRGAGLLAHITPIGRIAVADVEAMVVLVVVGVWLSARHERSWRDAAAWLVLCVAWLMSRSPPPDDALRITFLDVGQGDAALVELPDGAVWLIDAGGTPGAPTRQAARASGRTIHRALAAYGHDRIDLAIISHPHPDHYLGLAALEVPIAELWSATELEPTLDVRMSSSSFAAVESELAVRGTKLTQPPLGLVRQHAGVELIVYAPRYRGPDAAPVIQAADPVRSVNDNSLVVGIRYRDRAVLFAGDLEHEGEAELVAGGLPRFDVVKVPHHGSPTSSSQSLVDATRPSIAVISCGRANSFGFPSPAVVARWRAAGADVARTDRDGAITVVIDDTGAVAIQRAIESTSR